MIDERELAAADRRRSWARRLAMAFSMLLGLALFVGGLGAAAEIGSVSSAVAGAGAVLLGALIAVPLALVLFGFPGGAARTVLESRPAPPRPGTVLRGLLGSAVWLALAVGPAAYADDVLGPALGVHWTLHDGSPQRIDVPPGTTVRVSARPAGDGRTREVTCTVLHGGAAPGDVATRALPSARRTSPVTLLTVPVPSGRATVGCDARDDGLGGLAVDRVGGGWFVPVRIAVAAGWGLLVTVVAGRIAVRRLARGRPGR